MTLPENAGVPTGTTAQAQPSVAWYVAGEMLPLLVTEMVILPSESDAVLAVPLVEAAELEWSRVMAIGPWL
jgi:hypothetical protein